MGLLDPLAQTQRSPDLRGDAAHQLETLVLKQVLTSSGAFKGTQAAGAAIWSDLLAEAVAESVSKRGGLGLAKTVEESLPAAVSAQVPPVDSLVAGAAHVSSRFGARVDPLDHERHFHDGLDVAAAEGTPILAARDGVVVEAGPRGGYGNSVELSHGDGTTTLYAHAGLLMVKPGQHVARGEPIAAVGSTGRSTGPHLHFEVRQGGRSVDPEVALQIYRRRVDDETEVQTPGTTR